MTLNSDDLIYPNTRKQLILKELPTSSRGSLLHESSYAQETTKKL